MTKRKKFNDKIRRSLLRELLLTALFAALTAVGALLRIPVGHSFVTLQTFFTCMAGMLLGPWWGALSQLLYLLLGLLGVPVFSGGGGPMYLAQPTFGFLLGMVPMALVVGLLTRGRSGFWRLLPAGALGLVALYALGLPWFWGSLGGALPFGQAVVSGCLIFLPFDLLKLLGCALLGTRLLPALHRLT